MYNFLSSGFQKITNKRTCTCKSYCRHYMLNQNNRMFYNYVSICVMTLFLNCSIVFYGEKYLKKIVKNGKDTMNSKSF